MLRSVTNLCGFSLPPVPAAAAPTQWEGKVHRIFLGAGQLCCPLGEPKGTLWDLCLKAWAPAMLLLAKPAKKVHGAPLISAGWHSGDTSHPSAHPPNPQWRSVGAIKEDCGGCAGTFLWLLDIYSLVFWELRKSTNSAVTEFPSTYWPQYLCIAWMSWQISQPKTTAQTRPGLLIPWMGFHDMYVLTTWLVLSLLVSFWCEITRGQCTNILNGPKLCHSSDLTVPVYAANWPIAADALLPRNQIDGSTSSGILQQWLQWNFSLCCTLC